MTQLLTILDLTSLRRLALALVICALGWVPAARADGTCQGEFPNIFTDVCWSCIGPVTIGGFTVSFPEQDDNGSSQGFFCFCQNGANVQVGVKMGFWEPARIAEVVREPYCFPTLGGVKMNMGVRAPGHYREPDAREGHGKSFYQMHWYVDPLMYLAEVLLDSPCLDKQGFDLAYMTELDPLWSDSESTFFLNPDASLFTSVAAQAACAADCVAASTGFSINTLFWCAGCQGAMYPLTGWVGTHLSGIQASSLLVQRMTNKLHREGVMWVASGDQGLCGYAVQPIMDKSNYKSQMLWPAAATTKFAGKCCQPYGRTTTIWQAGKEIPYRGGENFSYQVFRKRDCCQGAS